MRTLGVLSIVAMLAAACAPVRPEAKGPPGFYVPTAALVNSPRAADRVLVGPMDGAFAFRVEKTAAGNIPLAGVTAFTTYTYDAQNISLPSGFGYRYRWVTQTGISSPAVP